MFLEDFSSKPIAMCKILLYVESIEIHIAGENDMKRLAWLSVEDYAATQMELVVVSAMKGYLRRMPEKEAFKKVEAILDPKVIRLAGDDGAPMPIQSNVDGAMQNNLMPCVVLLMFTRIRLSQLSRREKYIATGYRRV